VRNCSRFLDHIQCLFSGNRLQFAERLETVVALLAFIMIATFLTALLLFLRR
jgi:hypothetical protein